MKNPLILIFVLGWISSAYGIPLSMAEKKEFVEISTNTCFSKQREAAVNRDFSAEDITRYCSCYADKMANSVSQEELLQMSKTRNTEVLRPHVDAAGAFCRPTLPTKW